MPRLLPLASLLLPALAPSTAAQGGLPPAHDACAEALVLTDGTTAGSLVGSTYDGVPVCYGGLGDLWFDYTAPCSGQLTVTTCGTHDLPGQDVGMDTVLGLYDGCPAAGGSELQCDDDWDDSWMSLCMKYDYGFARDAALVRTVNAGETYRLRVSRLPSAPAGDFLLNVDCEPSAGIPYCFGDGSSIVACPCGNSGAPGHGCDNSFGTGGGVLAMTPGGNSSVAQDSVELTATGLPPTAPALYFQGTDHVFAMFGEAFGDGLRCVQGTVVRLGTRFSENGASAFPGPGGTPISVAGGLPPGGGPRYYQVWYRNAADFCSPEAFNLTNGLELYWTF